MKTNKKEVHKTDLFSKLVTQNVSNCVCEYKFHPTRKWRFDYAIVDLKIAIEIDGGVWINGRHNRASGYIKDMEKFNEAAKMGWIVLKITPEKQFSNETFELIKETVKNIKLC